VHFRISLTAGAAELSSCKHYSYFDAIYVTASQQSTTRRRQISKTMENAFNKGYPAVLSFQLVQQMKERLAPSAANNNFYIFLSAAVDI
jgi:hypothetical protein